MSNQPPPAQPPHNPQQSQPQQGQASAPGPEISSEIGYGQNLVQRGPTGPTKESTRRKLSVPGSISIIVSSIYLAILLGAVAFFIIGFVASSAALKAERDKALTTAPGGKGAKGKMLAQKRKEEKEQREEEYEYGRSLLFAGLGVGLVALFTGITTQSAGIVSGVNMARLNKYSWAFWGLLFSGIPFCSISFLIMMLFGLYVGGYGMTLAYLISFVVLDFVRFCLMFWGILALISGSRRFFEVR